MEERNLPRVLLAITAAFALLQLLILAPLERYLIFDEAIYLSQVHPDVPTLSFSAPRARGLPWLLAPVGVFGPPVAVVRLYLLAVTSGLFFLAFRAWLPVLGRRAVLAAAVFGVSWLALFNGTELYPNLLVALGSVLAAGCLAQHLVADAQGERAWRPLLLAGAGLTFVAVIRPSDATFLAGALGLAAFTAKARTLLSRWGVLAGALAAGWIPWVVEAFVSYGGLGERLADASQNVDKGSVTPWEIAVRHLALTDGPLLATNQSDVPVIGLLWWLILAVCGVVALVRGIIRRDPRLLVPALAGAVFAVEYLLLTSVVTARFLLPVYALATLCVAAVLPRPSHRTVWAAAAVLLAAWAGWNLHVAVGIGQQQLEHRAVKLALGEVLRARANGGECYFASQHNVPDIQFASRCLGVRFDPDSDHVKLRRDPGPAPVFVLSTRPPEKSAFLRSPGTVERLDAAGAPGWWLFVPADRSVLRWPVS